MTQQHHRAASIFAGIFTLLQSIIWVVLSILLIASYTCHLNLPFNSEPGEITQAYLLYVTYFKGECRHEPVASSASRTYVWLIIYAIFSAIWIPTSVLLFVAAIGNVKGKYGASLYYPWIVVTACIQLIDLIATVFYAIDITQTMTVADYKTFILPVDINLKGADGLTVIPAIELTAFFCRAVVVWCINLILLGVVMQAARCVAKNKPPTSTNYSNNIRKSAEDDRSQISGEPIRERAAKQRWVFGEDSPEDMFSQEEGIVRIPQWQQPQYQQQQQQYQQQQQPPWIITQGGNLYNREASWDQPYRRDQLHQQYQPQQYQPQQQHQYPQYPQQYQPQQQQQYQQYPQQYQPQQQQQYQQQQQQQQQEVYTQPHKARAEPTTPQSGRDTPASVDNSANDRTFDVNGRPIAEAASATAPYNRKFHNKAERGADQGVGVGGGSPNKREAAANRWSYNTPGSEILARAREGLKPVGPPLPLPDYSVHIPAVKRYPSIPAELQASHAKEQQDNQSQITRSSSMSNVY